MKPSYRIAVALSTLFLALPAYGHGAVSVQVFGGVCWILFLLGMAAGIGVGLIAMPSTRWPRHLDDDEKWWRKKPD